MFKIVDAVGMMWLHDMSGRFDIIPDHDR